MPADSLRIFEQERRRLTGLAYRMLGAVSEAEDVVQDAWLRWQGVEAKEIANPQAWLSTVVTRAVPRPPEGSPAPAGDLRRRLAA
ncbi:sigma factor [Fodinicurvata halophila]|uniref:Sigma factor n=1 Tax=Fodinicurvata halophila TaxID=1419723 RepID=A0ABV8UQ98_9PROT